MRIRGIPGIRDLTISILLCVSVCVPGLFAGTYSGGAGTAEDPYQIGTVADWQQLVATRTDWDKSFILISDLDLSEMPYKYVGWVNPKFNGSMDGRGHVIRNSYCNLFGYIGPQGKVNNLGMMDVRPVSDEFVGGLCASNGGTIRNCFTTGTNTARDYVGGLCGVNTGTIISCFSSVETTGRFSVGGFCGQNGGGFIRDCYATGSVNWSGLAGWSYIFGGFVGYNSGQILNCYSIGQVVNMYITAGFCGVDGFGSGSALGCFWDKQTSGLETSKGGVGVTTAEMQNMGTFLAAGWDFVGETANGTDDFWLTGGNGYPTLNLGTLTITAPETRYYSIPGRASEDYFSRFFKEGKIAEVTTHGTTVVVVKLFLGGLASAFQTIELSSETADEVNAAGEGSIDLPTIVQTDSQGQAEIKVKIQRLYRHNDKPGANSVDTIKLKARGGPGYSFVAELELPVLDNYRELKRRYDHDIPLGLVHRRFNELTTFEQVMVSTDIYAGAVTNARSYTESDYNPYTCGGYQVQTLYWLDLMRLSPELRYILNGYDYGPVMQFFGFHLASEIWPSDSDPYDLDYARILDPWAPQKPNGTFYTWQGWMTAIGLSMPFLGTVLDLFTGPGSNVEFLNNHYPNTGNPYPETPYYKFEPETAPRLSLIVNCPVFATISDGQNRRSGWTSAEPGQGQNPWINGIPGVRFYSFRSPDGTLGSYFELPAGVFDLMVDAYGSGRCSIYLMTPEGVVSYRTNVTEQDNGTMTLDTSNLGRPVLRFADGRTVAPEEANPCGDAGHPRPIGDYNGDCTVSLIDLEILSSGWQIPDPQHNPDPLAARLDLDGDNQIGLTDLLELAEHWMECSVPAPLCNFQP